MKYLQFLKFAVPALLLLLVFSAGNAQTLGSGNMAPNVTPRAEIMTWLSQNRIKAKNVYNAANQQNLANGPTIRITGDPITDQASYQAVKSNWINQNQGTYANARQQQLQYMQSQQNNNVKVDRPGEKRRVTSGNGFIIPVQGNTGTGNN